MLNCFSREKNKNALPIELVKVSEFPNWLQHQSQFVQNWLQSSRFRPDAGKVSLIPSESGHTSAVICCIAEADSFWSVGNLPFALPEGEYFFENNPSKELALVWGLGAYQFSRYRKPTTTAAILQINSDQTEIENIVESIYWVRDLINIPTEDLGPSELAREAEQLAERYQASIHQIVGDALLKENYPAIHAVGRASDDAPRLIDLRWGEKHHKKITLVGKGVCFDSGGLDLKPSQAMLLMKKDMGGAAHALGLARMIMAANLPISLRVLIPAVENVVSGNAFRPGDIIQSRKGLSIEIGNTDAEGRLVLADALFEAAAEKPDLIIDFATLTGAARVALGTELPALFSNHDEIAGKILKSAADSNDPLWRLPLFSQYRELLNTPFADINNVGNDSYGGAIIAALFLKEFVGETIPWVHLDMMAWNLKTRPGRPQGGEAMGLRGIFNFLSS